MYQAALGERELSLYQRCGISSHLLNPVKNAGKWGVLMRSHLSSHSAIFLPFLHFVVNISMAIFFFFWPNIHLPTGWQRCSIMRVSVASPSSTAASDYTLPPPVIQSNPSCNFTPRGEGGREQGKNEAPSISAVLGQLLLVDLVLSGQASILLLFWSLPLLRVTGQSKRKWRAAGWLELHLPTHFLFLFPRLFKPALCRSCQLRASSAVNYSELFS